ncbi:McrC family protein [Shouchella rhizosphaerae]|uniref:McrC family protein n=1 Tax=Shouchella rhizosphaerae TaxID=866786 RepID=UPI00203BC9A0|nr:McrC family protein [Shouchella rhizosphaerae]MCM3382137.1 McrC family protein [Shouchella rhizosphaerae]
MILKIKVETYGNYYIRDIPEVKNGEINEEWLHKQLIDLYYSTISNKKIEPYKLTYGRNLGYCIVTNANVGILHSDEITVIIESSVPGLDIGKILYLSSISNSSQTYASGKTMETLLNNDLSINTIDYFVVSYLEVLENLIREGLIVNYRKENAVKSTPKGRLDIERQVRKSPSYEKYHIKQNVLSTDLIINQVLYKALLVSLQNTSLKWAIPKLNEFLLHFDDFNDTELEKEDFRLLLDEFTTLPRPDYKEALILAEHIIFGYDPYYGDNYDVFPEYLIDMNEVFENYVVNSLIEIFKTGFHKKYKLSLGLSPNDPKVNERFIELDGFYQGDVNIILDTKNKYTGRLSIGDSFLPTNQDIYQQHYYAQRADSANVVLIYPYTTRQSKPLSQFKIERYNKEITFTCWGLQVTGSPKENQIAMRALAKFIDNLK